MDTFKIKNIKKKEKACDKNVIWLIIWHMQIMKKMYI